MDTLHPKAHYFVIGLAIALMPGLDLHASAQSSTSQRVLLVTSIDLAQESQPADDVLEVCNKKRDRNPVKTTDSDEAALQLNRRLVMCQQAVTLERTARRLNSDKQYQQSVASYKDALKLYRQLDWPVDQALTLSSMSGVYKRDNRLDFAFQSQLQAIDLARTISDRDRKSQLLSRLTWTSSAQFHNRFEMALKLEQKMLKIYREMGDRKPEAHTLSRIGSLYYNAKQFKQALDFRQQAYDIYEQLGETESQASLLVALGNAYLVRGVFMRYGDTECLRQDQYDQALPFYQQAVEKYRTLAEKATTSEQKEETLSTFAESLTEIADKSSSYACQHEQAIAFYQQATSIYRQLGNKVEEANILNRLGKNAILAKRFEQASRAHQQALDLYQTLKPRHTRHFLRDLSRFYQIQGYPEQAIKFGQKKIELAQSSGDQRDLASAFQHLGSLYSSIALNQSFRDLKQEFPEKTESERKQIFRERPLPKSYIENYQNAIAAYQQVLQLYRDQDDKLFERGILLEIGYAYDALRQDSQALSSFRRVLALERRRNSRDGEAHVLRILGKRHYNRKQYKVALGHFKESLKLYQHLNDRSEAASTLREIGASYRKLQQYDQAFLQYEQVYELYKELELDAVASWTLKTLGELSLELGKPQQGLDYFQKAANYPHKSQGLRDQQKLLADIGDLYLKRDELPLALDFHRQYVAAIQAEGDRIKDITTLNRLGRYYQWHQQFDSALHFYQKALAVSRELQKNPDFQSFDGTGIALSGIGNVMAQKNQPALATVFQKAAINHFESIRSSYAGSELLTESDFSQLFLEKHADTYRSLADLLLQQDRIIEAQQVLDRLKIQELEDYLHNVRASVTTAEGIDVLRPEQQILGRYNQLQASAIELGQELRNLETIPESKKNTKQKQRQAQLARLEIDLNAQFNDFIDSDELQALIAQLTRTTRQQNVNLEDLAGLSDNLQDYNAALLYPLILDDRLELIITTPNSSPLRRTVTIPKTKLNQTVQKFREQLMSRDPQVKDSAQQLYRWLIAPLDADLKQAGVDTIVYAPDGVLRYIPLAALHDGQQWLTERFQVNHITARSLTDFNRPRSKSLSALAGAFTQGSAQFRVGDRTFNFWGLPFTGQEVEDLVATLPNSRKFLNQDFSPSEFIPRLNQYSIIHFATHAAFITGQPEESFIVFGNGERVTLSEIKNWRIPEVDLVVLSACETGVGGFGNGAEILGLGYQFQRAGARAAMASLWQVDDGGTQVLMTEFYRALEQGMSKTKALQTAQKAMIDGRQSASGGDRGRIKLTTKSDWRKSLDQGYLEHPYFWAPFILIGNGL